MRVLTRASVIDAPRPSLRIGLPLPSAIVLFPLFSSPIRTVLHVASAATAAAVPLAAGPILLILVVQVLVAIPRALPTLTFCLMFTAVSRLRLRYDT